MKKNEDLYICPGVLESDLCEPKSCMHAIPHKLDYDCDDHCSLGLEWVCKIMTQKDKAAFRILNS